ncbi:hypothetical protein V0M98_33610 (plasmid) [Pseudomonas silesiensis]|uniref:hypothetical protein n=1 Tax=Pseudomonas silesiensis TaxID=1853130 RepID=UPI0030CB9FBA
MDTKDFKAKLSQLESIQSAADSVSKGHFSPYVMVITLVVVVATFFGLHLNSWGMSAIICLVVFIVGAICGKFSRSWSELLDYRLTEYEPLDFLAYAKLQALTKDRDGFEINSVLRWIDHEEMVIRSYLPKRTDGRGQRFMSKDLTKFADPAVDAELREHLAKHSLSGQTYQSKQ